MVKKRTNPRWMNEADEGAKKGSKQAPSLEASWLKPEMSEGDKYSKRCLEKAKLPPPESRYTTPELEKLKEKAEKQAPVTPHLFEPMPAKVWAALDDKARLPLTADARKAIPLAAVLDYFPDALCDVARVIRQGQVQHSTDAWDRSKSTDHADCLQRHFLERGSKDVDGLRHSAKMVWRALALLQLELEAELGLGPSRGSK